MTVGTRDNIFWLLLVSSLSQDAMTILRQAELCGACRSAEAYEPDENPRVLQHPQPRTQHNPVVSITALMRFSA
jgi:hypothetical protein